MSGGTRSYEIGRRLAAAGHQVEMVTSWREPSQHRDWFVEDVSGLRVHWLPVPYSNLMGYAARVKAFFRFAAGAARYAAKLDGDLIFATSTPLTIALPAVYAARRKRLPMVFEVRDLWPELPIAIGALNNPVLKFAARRLERFAYANAARVIALSPGMAEGVAATGYDPQRLTIVPNSADLDLFAPEQANGLDFRRQHNIGKDKIVVGYAGTLGRINDVSYLVRLASKLQSDNRFQFVVIGDGQEKQRILDLAIELHVINKNLLLLPSIAKSQMPSVLASFDIATSLFLPLVEMQSNSANKFFDALAAARCIAINYGGWHADLVRSANAGIVLPSKIDQAAAALSALAENPMQIRRKGINARRLAETEFSRDELAKRIESVFIETLPDVL